MGYVCNELLLVIFRTGDFTGHVGQGGRQISHFVLAFYGKLIVHIAAGILLGCLGDLAQRNIDDLREEDQDNERQQEQDHKHEIGDGEQTVGRSLYAAYGFVNDNITFYFIIGRDGGEDTQHGFIEGMEKIAYHVIGAGSDRGIEILDHHLCFHVYGRRRIQDHAAGRVNDPEGGVQIGIQCIQLCLDRFQRNFISVQIHCVGIRNQRGFPIKRIRLLFLQVVHSHVGDKSGNHNEAKQTEDDIGKY